MNGFLTRHRAALGAGMRDGVPIALGYLAVSFTLGIAARNAGLSAVQGFFASLLNNASAGEYAGFTSIAAKASFWELALVTLVTNARYLLMSCSLSQKFSPDTRLVHRFLVGYDVTDEIFGISIARPGPLDPWYVYGAMLLALPGWSIGTYLGVMAGNLLPARIVSALSVALYGMFLAVVVPPAKKNRVVGALVVLSFAASFLAGKFTALSAGTRTIVLTLALSAAAALFFPHKEEEAPHAE
jgi:predicted branched-subunit amino acid permease